MTAKDIMIQTDVDGTGGLIVIRNGDDPEFIKRTVKNSVKCSGPMAQVLKVLRDDILELQGVSGLLKKAEAMYVKPVAKKKGGA